MPVDSFHGKLLVGTFRYLDGREVSFLIHVLMGLPF